MGPISLASQIGALVTDRIGEQVAEIRRYEPQVRAQHPEGIHQLRVALRRLRTALTAYRQFLDRSISDPLGLELKWLGAMMSPARDVQVQAERLSRVGAETTAGQRIQSEVDALLHERYVAAYDLAISALNSARYDALLVRLDDVAASPPLNKSAEAAVGTVLPQRIADLWERVAQRVEAARITTDEMVRAEELHEVRKWVKRLRYAAEPLARLGDTDAATAVRRAKSLQDTLGEHQDTVAARLLLADLTRSDLSQPTVASLRARATLEQAIAAQAEAEFFSRWDAGSPKPPPDAANQREK